MADDRERFLFLANLCQNSQFYEDALEFTVMAFNQLAHLTRVDSLLLEERFRQVINSYRQAILALRAVNDFPSAFLPNLGSRYFSFCDRLINLIDTKMLPLEVNTDMDRAYYMSLKGEMLGCVAEFKTGTDRSLYISRAKLAFQLSKDISFASPTTGPSHHFTLDISQQYSLFLYHIARDAVSAVSILNQASQAAVGNNPDLLTPESLDVLAQIDNRIFEWTSQIV